MEINELDEPRETFDLYVTLPEKIRNIIELASHEKGNEIPTLRIRLSKKGGKLTAKVIIADQSLKNEQLVYNNTVTVGGELMYIIKLRSEEEIRSFLEKMLEFSSPFIYSRVSKTTRHLRMDGVSGYDDRPLTHPATLQSVPGVIAPNPGSAIGHIKVDLVSRYGESSFAEVPTLCDILEFLVESNNLYDFVSTLIGHITFVNFIASMPKGSMRENYVAGEVEIVNGTTNPSMLHDIEIFARALDTVLRGSGLCMTRKHGSNGGAVHCT